MDYQEFNNCVDVLRKKPKWFFQGDNLASKIACLDKFKTTGTPANISFLVEFLYDDNRTIREKTADAIIQLYQLLKSQNELYESLKFVNIQKADINFYKSEFDPTTYVHLLAIASMNKNGHAREMAIKELAASQNPDAIKFILFRLGDWVAIVRETAQNAIKTFFKPQFIEPFLQQLQAIDWLLEVQRTDLSANHSEIIEFILSHDLTTEFYKKLKRCDEKTRLIYFRLFLNSKEINEEVAAIVSADKNYLIRAELIKHIKHLEAAKQDELISRFLNDRSARIRVNTLYETERFPGKYDPTALEMISDESASVRQLARYLLKNKTPDFAEIYRHRLTQNQNLVGNILGLSEVGTKDDVPTFEKHLRNASPNVKLACLTAVQRLEPSIAKKYALELLAYPNKRLQNKSVEILAVNADSEVLENARVIYRNGTHEQKKTILKLFNQIGGWNVIADLILAITDDNENIQDLAWMFLQKWIVTATKLFTVPPEAQIKRANEIYQQLDKSKIKMTYHREKLWSEIPFYISG
jgi:HEAT repeat protein